MTSRYLKRLYEIAPYITELRGPNTPPRTGVVGVAAPARERRASNAQNRQIRRQRRKPTYLDSNVSMEGTEIKMNRYMQALTEVRGRRVRTTRSNRTSDKRPAATTDPRPVGGRVTHSPAMTPQEIRDQEAKTDAAAKRRRENSWTEYQRIGSILAEEKPRKPSDEWDPDAGEHPSAAREAETGEGSDFEPGTGPKARQDMTPAELAALDKKTKLLIARRASQRAASMRKSGTPEPRGGHTRRS